MATTRPAFVGSRHDKRDGEPKRSEEEIPKPKVLVIRIAEDLRVGLRKFETLKTEASLSDFGRARLRRRLEKLDQARLVEIAHGRFAAGLDPFRMLPAQVVVNLLLKLGHGVGPLANYQCFERSPVRGEHNELDKRAGAFVQLGNAQGG